VQLAVGEKNSLAGSGTEVEAYGLVAAKLRDDSWVDDLMESRADCSWLVLPLELL
jgi:hypothetical protein